MAITVLYGIYRNLAKEGPVVIRWLYRVLTRFQYGF